MATNPTADPRWRWTVSTELHPRLREVRPQIAKAAGMSVDDALWHVKETHRLGEETDGFKGLKKAFQSSEYRDLTMNWAAGNAFERSDINVRNVFDESSWGFIKQNRWFSQLVTAGLTAAVGGAAFAGVGAGGAAAGSGAGAGAGGAAAGGAGAGSAVSLGSISGELAGLSVSSGTAAGLGVGSQAGAYLGVTAGGAAGAAGAAAPSFSNAWQVGGSGGAGAGGASSLLTADNAVKGLKAASGLLGASGIGGAGGAGYEGPPRIQPPPVAPIAPGNVLRPASPSVVRAAKTAQRRAAPQGRASTILTSGRGLLTKPTLGRKMLLGQ